MKKRREYFDHQASSWDQKLEYEKKSFQLPEVIKWFELTRGDSVLDVGTGTGILLPFLREAIGLKGRLVAMDFSIRMLEKAAQRQWPGEKILINASVEGIPFHSGQFDRITCFSAFPHFPNKMKALYEMVRVLKSGGRLFIAHLHSVEEINQFHRHVGGEVAQDLLPDPEKVRSLLKESGLDEVLIVNQPGKFLAKGKKT